MKKTLYTLIILLGLVGQCFGFMALHGSGIATTDTDCTVPSTDLVFHDTMDSITNTHTAETGETVSVGTSPPTLDTSGKCDSAAYWDSIDDDGFSFTISGSGIDRDKGTIIFWYLPDATTPATTAYLFSNNTASSFLCYISSSDGRWNFKWNSVSSYAASAPTNISTTEYNKVLLNWSVSDLGGGSFQTVVNVYINDVLVSDEDSTNTNDIALPTTFFIGQKDSSDNESCQGKIDNFTIYSEVITP